MKAAMAASILVAIVACSGAISKPTASATLHWATVPLKLGSYCWASGGQGECADSAAPEALLHSGYLVPYRSAGCQSALIKFSSEPEAFEVELVYSTAGSTGPIANHDFQFDISSVPGTYVYAVMGKWAEGDVSFFLPLEIIPGCE